eukprot:Nitzschia sp. Nitz4//scaffold61_size107673//75813//77597//NITZ4_004247-RA/size107673-processed-gene-0.194-mRNA-1//-1//CDS//3329555746//4582//frame0
MIGVTMSSSPIPETPFTIQTSPQKSPPSPSKVYRHHFSCEFIGKFNPSSKRRLTWKFGFPPNSRSGSRGEEHTVQLVWSVHSGKVAMYWNRFQVSDYVTEVQTTNRVQLRWDSERLAITIDAAAKPRDFQPQYDLRVNGVSVFKSPRLSDLPTVDEDDLSSGVSELSDDHGEACSIDEEGNYPQDYLLMPSLPEATFPAVEVIGSPVALEDELTFSVHSKNLDLLRDKVARAIPGSDDLVSQSIIKTLSDCRDSQSSGSSLSYEDSDLAAMQMEADAIWETLRWLEVNSNDVAIHDSQDQKRALLQKHMSKVFTLVRRETVSEDAALRVLAVVSTMLQLKLKKQVKDDLILLEGVDQFLSDDDIRLELEQFGEVVGAAMSRGRRFAICRFRDEKSVSRALEACRSGALSINGERPILSTLKSSFAQNRPSRCERSVSAPTAALGGAYSEFPPIEKPILTRKRSHQRNTITIDTAITSASFLLDACPSLVFADESASQLRPHGFSNTPANFPPSVYNTPVVSP